MKQLENLKTQTMKASPSQNFRISTHHKPLFVAKRIATDLFEDKEDTNPQGLQLISEEPVELSTKVSPEKQGHPFDFIDTERSSVKQCEKSNVFEAELLNSTRYKEINKGPIFRNGKVIKHSIVGSPEIFERPHKPLQRLGTKNHDTDSSFTSMNESLGLQKLPTLALADQSPSLKPSTGTSPYASPRITEIRKWQSKKMTMVPKQELVNQIEDIKGRQEKFYNDMVKSAQGMRTSDQIYLTKEERCLKLYNDMQEKWEKIFSETSLKVGRSPGQSIAQRGIEHRMKREQVEALEAVKNDKERFGSQYWELTLRKSPYHQEKRGLVLKDDFPKGFYTGMVDVPVSPVEMIRQPFSLASPMSTRRTSSSNFLTPRSTHSRLLSSEYLQEKLKTNQKKISQYQAKGNAIDQLGV